MSEHFRISVHFLDGEFHGRGDSDEPEWPPSPLRLFQALTNAAARLDGGSISQQNASALRWLEALKEPPEIFAVKATPTNGYQLYVPDNVGDLVAKQWSAGKYFDSKNHYIDISGYRTEKRIRPLRLSGDAAVDYLWTLDNVNEFAEHCERLISIARAVTHLGWGVDLVVTDAVIEQSNNRQGLRANNSADRWLPVKILGGTALRSPSVGTLDDLDVRHAAFLGRIQTTDNGKQFFRPVPPLATFRVVTYRRESELSHPPFAIFSLREPDDSKFATFDPQLRRLHLAGMLRHSMSQPDFVTSLGWDEKKVCAFVLGHEKSDLNNSKPTTNTARLLFIPLPSIEWRGEKHGRTVGAIRRILITISNGEGPGEATEFSRIVRALEGRELTDEKTNRTVAFLRRQSGKDDSIGSYFEESSEWATVTPVVLPGHDDPRKLRRRLSNIASPLTVAEKEHIIRKLDTRIERLLRKALLDSGLPAPLVADAELQWRAAGFLPGADLASRYSVPDQCRRFRRLHVRVVWRERGADGTFRQIRIRGPFCVGKGRFLGLGLFAHQ